MNRLLLCAYHLQKLRPHGGKLSVRIVIDDPSRIPEDECRRMFSPWSAWATIVGYGTSLGDASPGEIVLAPFDGCATLRAECGSKNLECLGPDFGAAGTLDNDLIREASFFDFEFGGKNEWDGSPVHYSSSCLRQLSVVHCREYYPEWGIPRSARPLKAMDIGCGPVSVLRWGAIRDYVTVTGVDPLLNMYAMIRARHGLDALPKISCDREISDFAENLDSRLERDFDIVFTQNALDHTQQPARVVTLMGEMLRPGGYAVVKLATREGTRQGWDQLHKTDIFMDEGELMYQHQHQAPAFLLAGTGLRLDYLQCYTEEWLEFRLVSTK